MATGMDVTCPNCGFSGEATTGKSTFLRLFFLIGGFFTAGILWLAWIFYEIATSNLKCPACQNKNVAIKNKLK